MDETQQEPDDAMPQTAAAQVAPRTRLDKILGVVPRALSSHAHIVFVGALGAAAQRAEAAAAKLAERGR